MGRVTLVTLAFLLIGFLAPAVVVADHASQLVSAASVWPLTSNGRNICTVTSINQERRLWLTAAHCVANEDKEVLAIMGDATSVVLNDVVNDIAILATTRTSAPALKLAKVGPHCTDRACDAVRVIGYPFGFPFQVAVDGKLAAESGLLDPNDPRPYALFNLTGAPGNSGSAIVNARGEVVSVLQVGWGRSWSPIVGGVVFETLAQYRKYFAS